MMGVFDSVWFTCPNVQCRNRLEVQSKAGECILRDIEAEAVPLQIAADIRGKSERCERCGNTWTILDGLPTTVGMCLG